MCVHARHHHFQVHDCTSIIHVYNVRSERQEFQVSQMLIMVQVLVMSSLPSSLPLFLPLSSSSHKSRPSSLSLPHKHTLPPHHILHDHEWDESTLSRALGPTPTPVVIQPTQQNKHLPCFNTVMKEQQLYTCTCTCAM